MPTIHGLTATVVVDGSGLPEHQVNTVDANTVECYVASEAGKVFELKFDVVYGIASCAFYVKLDGVSVGGVHSFSNFDPPRTRTTRFVRALLNGCRSTMLFDRLETTDDDDQLQARDRFGKVGVIEVTCCYSHPRHPEAIARDQMELAHEYDQRGRLDMPGVHPVHERLKKLTGHCIQLVDPIPWYPRVRSYYDGAVIANFIIYYLPEAILRAQEIIPMPRPITPPHEVDNDRDAHTRTTTDRHGKRRAEASPELELICTAKRPRRRRETSLSPAGLSQVLNDARQTLQDHDLGDFMSNEDNKDKMQRILQIVLAQMGPEVVDLTGDSDSE